MASEDFDFTEDEKEYDIERQGSYGRFYTTSSYPIEYILTTLRPEQLDEYLTFAKDVRPEHIDFDLLMQRDLDEDRVRDEIAPYLDPEPSGITSSGPRALFFPPLLVAIAPVQGKEMKSYYENEVSQIDTSRKRAYRKWGKNLFKLTYQLSSAANSPTIQSYNEEGLEISFQVKPAQVIFEAWKSKGNSPGVRLIVIDGQHRLKALQEVYRRGDGLIDNLLVPICLLFAPRSQERLKTESVLSVPEVFRQLFVDVNNTAETVGGHFNILLKDNNIGSLICRQFCSRLLEGDGEQKREDSEGKKRLAVVEWNTKKLKDSTNIVRKYSLTSIGVIEKALRENFKNGSAELEYWLNLNSIQDSLYPVDQEKGSFECPVVDWNTFNSRQRKFLAMQVDRFAVSLLVKIFFESEAYSFAFSVFEKQLKRLEEKCSEPSKGLSIYTPAVEQILDYMQIPVGKSREVRGNREHREALAVVRELGDQVSTAIEESGLKIILYALYQRAVIALWFDLLKIGNLFNVRPDVVGDVLIVVLNEAHRESMRHAFDHRKSYMQHAVFRSDVINPIEETKKALKSLLGSFLGRKETLEKISQLIGSMEINRSDFLAKLKELGDKSPAEFLRSFEKGFTRDFKKTYPLDGSLTSSEKDRLAFAEEKQKQHRKEFRDGSRPKEEISTEFDELISKYRAKALSDASNELKKTLGLSLDIIPEGVDEDYEAFEEQTE